MEKRMDKNAENDLIKQVKSYVLDGHFDKALKVIEAIDVNRIKAAPSLCIIGEVYMREKMYEDSESVFLKAYAKSPKNRRILNLLTSLYIEMGDYPEAEYYYKEFIAVASRDLQRYILRYRLDRAKGERKSVLINTLEKLKDYEYIEEWAYELAKLYHEAGEDEKSVHECDEIVLWFGNGEYVNKAIELKCSITGEPLPDYLMAGRQFGRADVEQVANQSNEYGGFDVDIVERAIREEEQKKAEWNKTVSEISEAMDVQSQKMNEDSSEQKAAKADTMTKDQLFDALSFGDTRADFWKSKDKKTEEDELFAKYASDDEPDNSDADDDLDNDEIISGSGGDDLYDEFFKEDSDSEFDDEDFFGSNSKEEADESLFEENLDDEDEDEIFSDEQFSEAGALFETDLDDEEKNQVSEGGNTENTQAKQPADISADSDDDDDDLIIDDDDLIEERVWTAEDKDFIAGLFENDSKTESNVLATVPNINYVKEQLSKTFTKFEETSSEKFDILASYDINFVVLSKDKSLKAQIALGIAKALNTYGLCDKSKIVRASAEDLNARDFSVIFDKLQGGCLIIEKADLLSEKSVSIIEWEVNKENQKTAIVLESFYDEMMQFWKKHQSLRSKFLNVINVSKYNEMELVTLAKGYIEQKKYEMDPEVALILRDYFKKCLDNNEVVNYEDVMSIVDVAITNVENRNSKNLFMTVLENRYEEASMFKLLPEDFKFLTR